MASFSELIAKMANKEDLNDIEKQQVVLQARALEQAEALLTSIVRPGTKILVIDGLIANDAQINDATIHSATAGDGHVVLGGSGIDIIEGNSGAGYLTFYDNDGVTRRAQIATDTGGMQIEAVIPGESVELRVNLTDASTPYLKIFEDTSLANRPTTILEPGVEGARFELRGDVGAGHDTLIDFRTQGVNGNSTFMRMRETANTPGAPGAGFDAYHMYMRNDKLIIQIRNGATIAYFYLDLAATTDQSWKYTTTAP